MGIRKWLIRALGGKIEERDQNDKTSDKAKSESSSNKEPVRYRDTALIFKEMEKSESSDKSIIGVYEKLAKIEEILRIIDERLLLLDGKVATREDSRAIMDILSENSKNQDKFLSKLDEINLKLDVLSKVREKIDESIEKTEKHLDELKETEKKVRVQMELLETHKRIIEKLSERPMSTIELANSLGYTRQYVWERLQELKSAGYVDSRKEGRKTLYYINT